MMKTTHFCLKLLIGVFFPLMVGAYADAADLSCPRNALIQGIQTAITRAGGTIEPVHLKDGVAIVITAKSSSAIKAVHKAIDAYLGKRDKYAAPSAESYCTRIMAAVKTGQLAEQTEKTSTGALLLYNTTDGPLIEKLHKDDCCQWCVCPAGTVTQCKKCC